MKHLAVINISGSLGALSAWCGLINPLLGFIAGLLGVSAGVVLLAFRVRQWRKGK